MADVDLKKFNPDVLAAANVQASDVVGEISAFLPITACKAEEDSEPGGKMIVEGEASTDHKDFEGEEADQDGLLWKYHLEHGWLTDGHVKTGQAISGLGHPLEAKKVTRPDGHKATKYRAFLLDTPENRKLYATIQAAVKLPNSRFGFSIQGPVLRRDPNNPKRLAQVLITDVALTRHPVNSHATLTSVAKSLDALNNGFEWVAPVAGSAISRLLDIAEKTLSAGHPDPSVANPGTGAPLVSQSINGGSKKMPKCSRENFSKVFPGLSDAEMAEKAKGLGIELTEDEDNEGAEGKAEEAKKALDAALADIRAHMEAGGRVYLNDAQPNNDETLTKLVEATKSILDGDEAAAKGVTAVLIVMGEQVETMKALRAEMEETKKALGELQGRPVLPRAVRPGVAMPNSRGEDGQNKDALPLSEARKALSKAITEESNKGMQTDKGRINRIGEVLTGLEARTTVVTKQDLANLGITI